MEAAVLECILLSIDRLSSQYYNQHPYSDVISYVSMASSDTTNASDSGDITDDFSSDASLTGDVSDDATSIDDDVSDDAPSTDDYISDNASSASSDAPSSEDNDVTVYRQSANFMLKLSELIYNHALEVSVKKSIHGHPGVKQAARRIAVCWGAPHVAWTATLHVYRRGIDETALFVLCLT